MPALVKHRGELFDGIGVPVTPDKHDPALPVQRLKKTVDLSGNFLRRGLILNRIRCGDAIYDLIQSDIVNAVSFLRGIRMVFL
jgi:hypothetical protein